LGLAPGDLVSEAFALSAKEAAAGASANGGAMKRKGRSPALDDDQFRVQTVFLKDPRSLATFIGS
jgi:hypothetical protein